jgi:hypothetical protein
MPTRKQRRREAKTKRHEYEFVYVDGEGKELDEVPDELVEPRKDRAESRNGASAKASGGKKAAQQPRGARGARVPPVPSWNRAVKRGAMLGAVVFALFSLTAKGNYVSILPLALLYTVLFIPFTYFIDRFAYRRYLAKTGGSPPAAKKR